MNILRINGEALRCAGWSRSGYKGDDKIWVKELPPLTSCALHVGFTKERGRNPDWQAWLNGIVVAAGVPAHTYFPDILGGINGLRSAQKAADDWLIKFFEAMKK